MSLKILVTGSNGVVGQPLCLFLDRIGIEVFRAKSAERTLRKIAANGFGQIHSRYNFPDTNIDSVVHLAAKVPSHDNDSDAGPDDYYAANTLATVDLAYHCAASGVKRFVFVSTIKVLGEGHDKPYSMGDLAKPAGPYGISKWRAEQALWKIAQETGMEVVVIRSPIVYGPRVKGNFLRLLRAIDKQVPMPLGRIQNRRSLVYVGNLVDLIALCTAHPDANGNTFLVSDGDDVSTPELLCRIATALNRRLLLVPVPVFWIKLVGKLLGKKRSIDRLVESLTVDISETQKALNWKPPYTMEEGLDATCKWFRNNQKMT